MLINIELNFDNYKAHEFIVRTSLALASAQKVTFCMPAWIPGSYMIRDFAKNVIGISSSQNAKEIKVNQLDKQTWSINADAGDLVINYRVYAWDLSVRTAYIDQTRAYFNGTSIFVNFKDFPDADYQLTLAKPIEAELSSWKASTTLSAKSLDTSGFGDYQAQKYLQLTDFPFEIGVHETKCFTINNINHEMIFTDATDLDIDRITSDVYPICAEHVAMFEELPVDKYLFMTLATANGYGGLEHLDSTSLICKRDDLAFPSMVGVPKGYCQFLALCSHEYFHLWNVKRIKPLVLQDHALDEEANTELLWAFEGITSYYDELALVRSETLDLDMYLDMLAPTLTRVIRSSGRMTQTVAQSSFDAWTKFYKQDENASNAIISYYAKGTLVAFGLDHLIRISSEDSYCLDDLMRLLWKKYGKTNQGIPERAIEDDIASLINNKGLVDDFFQAYIYGVDELPMKKWLFDYGIHYNLRVALTDKDVGGYVLEASKSDTQQCAFGAKYSMAKGLVKIDQVYSNTSVQNAGIAPGDLIVAVDGERVTVNNLQTQLNRKLIGSRVVITLFRRDQLMNCALAIQAREADTCELSVISDAELSDKIIARRTAWLTSSVIS